MVDPESQQPSIRLRRQSSSSSISQTPHEDNGALQVPGAEGRSGWGRPRASSGSSRLSRRRSATYLPRLEETPASPTLKIEQSQPLEGERATVPKDPLPDPPDGAKAADRSNEYESNLVDLLDLIDPEVQTLSTLTNVQNSLFVPDLGRFVNRRPSYTLTRFPSDVEMEPLESPTAQEFSALGRTQTSYTLASITSRQTARHYAVLPHGVRLEGWTDDDRRLLDDHVRHMLHSKRSKFKRSMKGFGQYVRRPLGFLITLYAFFITLFGLIWVLFLIGWINVGGRKYYIINVIDNVLVALFAIMGDGLAPFRCVDTYHMIFIAHYHHLTWRLRREQSLPELQDRNDLPSLAPPGQSEDFEAMDRESPVKEDEFRHYGNHFSVLNVKQQRNLVYHQKKFSKSHTFYKPHDTYTHHAFPLRLLVAIVVLLDCHSLLQISLGACTWGISYHKRPFALTTIILCCSITVNISAGILISIGDHKTRKKDIIDKMHRQELTAEAMKKLERKKQSGLKARGEKILRDNPLSSTGRTSIGGTETGSGQTIKISPAVPQKPVPSLQVQHP